MMAEERERNPRDVKLNRQQRITRVAWLHRRGWTQEQIAAEVGVTQAQVSRDLKLARGFYKSLAAGEVKELIEERTEQYRDTLRELWAAWERSKQDAVKVVEERQPEEECVSCDGTGKRVSAKGEERTCGSCKGKGTVGGLIKVVKTVEGRLPDAAYANQILRVLDQLTALQGLEPAKKMRVTGTTIPWDELVKAAGVVTGTPPEQDRVKQRMIEALGFDPAETNEVPAEDDR